ncbi:MAG TPA: carbon-nitrogen hydrolase family protein [Pseudonocardiaceae bacterium]|jgi:predicted amidohydrolase|nr:carbon-nitrogen hydrolase family protein [Pseudonocardiaceae bacterium]
MAPYSVRVAAAQFFSSPDVPANLALCQRYLRQAADAGAQLVVLPENANRVRDQNDRDACWQHSESLAGEFVHGLRETARELGILVAVGVDLRGEHRPDVHIASVLIGSDGDIIGVHHKHVLWDYEYTLFTPGDEPYQVFDTELGRIGLLLCADGIVPETPRALALLGAEILCNSLNSRGPDELRVHVPLRAMENRVWHVSANTVGGPPGAYPWMGGSQIVSPSGDRLAEASEQHAELIVADIVPGLARDKVDPVLGDVFARRRPDLYSILGEPLAEVPVAALYGPAAGPAEPVVVAALQVSHFPTADWSITRALGQIEYAGRRGVRLGVLPEQFCFDRGEIGQDPDAAARRSAEVLDRIAKACADAAVHAVASLVERDGDHLYSTAFLVDATGSVVHRYRKTHLRPDEAAWATPGDRLDVVRTEVGVLGLLVSDEIWVPEIARVLAVSGAEILCHPTDWDRDEAATVAATERAEENRVHLVSSTRLDSPARVGSQIVRADEFVPGAPIALMRYPTAYWSRPGFEEQVAIELDLREARSKMMGRYLDPLATRAPLVYGPLLR